MTKYLSAKYLYWYFLGLLFVGGIGISFYYGLQPKPIPKVKPSQVDSPERLGEAIGQRLWAELKDSPVIFLGVDPDQVDDLRVWKGLLAHLQSDMQYSTILIEPLLPQKALIPYTEEVDMKADLQQLKLGIEQALAQGKRMAFVVPSIYSSQAIPDNPINRLKAVLPIKVMSLSVARPSLRREEEATAQFPCATGGGDLRGLGSWGCLIQAKSRGLYLKKWTSGRYLGLVDQIGANDYLVLLRQVP